jgi:hypothetical protein
MPPVCPSSPRLGVPVVYPRRRFNALGDGLPDHGLGGESGEAEEGVEARHDLGRANAEAWRRALAELEQADDLRRVQRAEDPRLNIREKLHHALVD